jgi:hypothetical protein
VEAAVSVTQRDWIEIAWRMADSPIERTVNQLLAEYEGDYDSVSFVPFNEGDEEKTWLSGIIIHFTARGEGVGDAG